MLGALASLTGAGGMSTSSTAAARDTSQGGQSLSFGGIQTGGSSSIVPPWAIAAALGLAALWILKR